MTDFDNVVRFDKKRIEKGISDMVAYLTHCNAPAALLEITGSAAQNYYGMNDPNVRISFALHARDARGTFEQRFGLVKDEEVVPFGYISSSQMNMVIFAALSNQTPIDILDDAATKEVFDEHLKWLLRDKGVNDAFVYLTAMLRALLDRAVQIYVIDDDDATPSKCRHYIAMYSEATSASTDDNEVMSITFCPAGFDYNKEKS